MQSTQTASLDSHKCPLYMFMLHEHSRSVCLSSAPSILPSAKVIMKIPMSIPVQKFPLMQYPGKLPSAHTSMDSSVDPSGSPSITLSPSAEKVSKILSNNGEKHVINYLHEIMVNSLSIHTLYGMSVIPPVCASYIPSICTNRKISMIFPLVSCCSCVNPSSS